MNRDGSIDIDGGEPNACEVTAPDCQEFLDRVNVIYGTEFKMNQFAGR